MADNTTLDAGAGGDTIGSDDIAGVKYQRVKLIEGADGTNDGDIAAGNPLPVELTDIDGTAAADISAIKTAIQILDNTVAGSEQQVDVVTVPAPMSTTGGGTEATALRVTIASDSTGLVSVDDGGGALTVDGTVTETNSAAIKTAVELIDNAISGSEMQVDVVSAPALDRTTDNAGVAQDVSSLMSDTTALTVKYANIDTITSGNTAVVAAVAAKTLKVLSVCVFATGTTDVYFNDGTANLLGGTRKIKLDNTGATGALGLSLPFSPVAHFQTAAVNRPINLNCSDTDGVCGCLAYVEV